MTRQTWTAAVSALLFVVAAAFVALTPVPFVTLTPGPTRDLFASVDGAPAVSIEGLSSYDTAGRLLVTTVTTTRSDAPVSLPEVLYAHWAPDREVAPREVIYPARMGSAESQAREAQQLTTAKSAAAAAALRAAGVEVRQMPMVQAVASSGPAVDKLFPGDFVLAVDGVPTPNAASVRAQVEEKQIGESVDFTVLRDRERVAVTLETAPSKAHPGVPVWGGNLVMGYSYAPRVEVALDESVGGSSAGLMMALAIFVRVTPGNLIGDRVIAGTGEVDGAGNVLRVSGVREKLVGAERAGATLFIVPSANCDDLRGVVSPVRVVSVATLDDAINSLDILSDPASESLVRGCA